MARVSSSGLSSVLAGGDDTIAARATPAGAGALAVIRISGPRAFEAVRAVAPRWTPGEPWRAALVRLEVDGVADRAVAIPYRAPRSYTGEDMVELMVHGSPWLVTRALERLAEAGARPAQPGEFTRRAVANGKMTVEEALGLRDLVAAETRWQARTAQARAAGAASRRAGAIRDRVLELLAAVEAALDFAGQGVRYDAAATASGLEALRAELEAAVRAGRSPAVVRGAVRAVVTGPPNAGKSSLFNRLMESSRAIVSPRPGTTRDTVEGEIAVAGRAVVLVDTAGLGETGDALEAEGVRRAEAALADADLVLLVVGADQTAPRLPEGVAGRPVIRVRTRTDLAPAPEMAGWLDANPVTGEGVTAVREALERSVTALLPEGAGEGLLSPAQAAHAARAAEALARAPAGEPELVAEALREAARALEALVGSVNDEAVLDRVFATFCLGK